MWVLEGRSRPAADEHGSAREAASGPDDTSILAEAALDAVARDVADVTGAGDTVIATLALALAAGASLVDAAALATHAAGISVSKFGPATVSREELIGALDQR
jgi:D-beta-D-heptose 7-phosphate kinase/D-beta-D-heptose 1-phosphate adenosyltransferase